MKMPMIKRAAQGAIRWLVFLLAMPGLLLLLLVLEVTSLVIRCFEDEGSEPAP